MQQAITLENIKSDSDYLIFDTEYATTAAKMVHDMVAVDKNGQLAIIELKYSEGSLGGKSGIKKHYEDINEFADDGKISGFYDEMSIVLKQLQELGIVEDKAWSVTPQNKIQYILICAGTPNKVKVIEELESVELNKEYIDYKFGNKNWLNKKLNDTNFKLKCDDLMDIDTFKRLLK